MLRAARAAGRVGHRNVQSVVDTGVDDNGRPYMVLEALTGPTLEQLIAEENNGLELSRAVRLMIQLLEALNAIHGAGVTHRLVCPGLIRVEPVRGGDELLKLTDFGDSVMHDEGSSAPRLTRIPGSEFVAPELTVGNSLDPNVDVFAAGVVFQFLLTGEPAGFVTGPEEAVRAIERATAVSRQERFKDSQAFLQAITLFDAAKPRHSRTSSDQLESDLSYLQRRRTTHMRRKDTGAETAFMRLRASLLTVESIYKLTAKNWSKFVEKMPEVETMLPGSPESKNYSQTGVPVEMFNQLLQTADELLGRGDMVILTAIGEAVASRGIERMCPGMDPVESPEDFVKNFPTFWKYVARFGEVKVLECNPGSGRIAVARQTNPTLEFSAWMSGVIRGTLRKLGAVNVEVAIPASQSLGDVADVYGITYGRG